MDGSKFWLVSNSLDFDRAESYCTHEQAFEAWHALADTLEDGDSAYMQRYDANGDPDEDFSHELRKEDGAILEYYNGERLWA